MHKLVALSIACAITFGCGAPCWTPKEIPLEVVTLGMYGPACGARENARESATWQASEVQRCVDQGGDPAGCRCAVYGCARSYTNVRVNTR